MVTNAAARITAHVATTRRVTRRVPCVDGVAQRTTPASYVSSSTSSWPASTGAPALTCTAFDDPGTGRAQFVFHLHRLDHHHALPAGHGLPRDTSTRTTRPGIGARTAPSTVPMVGGRAGTTCRQHLRHGDGNGHAVHVHVGAIRPWPAPIERRNCGPPPDSLRPRRRLRAATTTPGRSDASAPTSGARQRVDDPARPPVRFDVDGVHAALDLEAKPHSLRPSTSAAARPGRRQGRRPRCAPASSTGSRPRPPGRPQRRTNRASRTALRCARRSLRSMQGRCGRRPARKCGVVRAASGRTGRWSGRRPRRTRRSARRIRAIACGAVVAPGDQLRDQRVVVRSGRRSPCRRRRCRRGRPGPSARRSASMRPGDGRKPVVRILGVDAALDGVAARARAARSGSRVSRSPRAMRICHCTRSMPVTISVTGCSTCRRVFISRK